jgi:hypothetical protein
MYSAWFYDIRFPPDDQDCEWVAMFILEANSESEALEWGDYLAQDYSTNNTDNRFFKSYVESPSEYQMCLDIQTTPRVKFGEVPSKEYIGW